MAMRSGDIARIDFGYFVRPGVETITGTPQVEPVLGYVVRTPDRVLLFDTGMGVGDAELEAHYRPSRIGLDDALTSVGLSRDEIGVVVNCHLHFDHCGGNPLLAGVPIVTQRTELAAARTSDYTLPELVDFNQARYVEVDGEVEIAPGCLLLPTPGHTAGHQALAVRCDDGTVVLAGQAHDTATEYGRAQLAWRARSSDTYGAPSDTYGAPSDTYGAPSGTRGASAELIPLPPPWLERIEQLDPARILFAHDNSVWTPASPQT
jgi:glyoxylase-like metal-dependent hydrolase (beta-lactamase superfamily II)